MTGYSGQKKIALTSCDSGRIKTTLELGLSLPKGLAAVSGLAGSPIEFASIIS